MKRIFFIRHAKSSWADANLLDIDRPLNSRGKHDAPIMAKILKQQVDHLDRVIISPSLRTKETSLQFCNTFGIDSNTRLVWSDLYHGSVERYYEVLTGLDDDNDCNVAVFGHNPTMTYIANANNSNFIDNVATCGIIEYNYKGIWQDFNIMNAEFVKYLYPKMFI